MERLLILTVYRILKGFTHTITECDNCLLISDLYENSAKKILKKFCADYDLTCDYTGGDNYKILI